MQLFEARVHQTRRTYMGCCAVVVVRADNISIERDTTGSRFVVTTRGVHGVREEREDLVHCVYVRAQN